MAYGDFRYPDVVRELGLTERSADLFAGVPPAEPGPAAQVVARFGARLGANINLHSGAELAGDPAQRLTGVCDFAVGRGPQLPHLTPPVLVLFEAKCDSIPDGFGPCVAAMVGAQRFNAREGEAVPAVHGCVTTGSLWRFLRLDGAELRIDRTEYSIAQMREILGILLHILAPPGA